jgi:hypothetical protein
MVPAIVAVVVVIAEAEPVTREGVELMPFPIVATFTAVLIPPPFTGIFPLYDCKAVGVNLTKISWEKEPPGCVNVSDGEYKPAEVVENVYPPNGPTVTSAVVRLLPVMVNEFGPAVVLIQTFPNGFKAVVEMVGFGVAVVNDCSVPYVVPPEFVAYAL